RARGVHARAALRGRARADRRRRDRRERRDEPARHGPRHGGRDAAGGRPCRRLGRGATRGRETRLSAVADIADLAPRQIWPGVVARAVNGVRMTFGLIELDPGSVVPEHSHEPEQVGVLLTGSMTFTIGGETRTLGPGGTWKILANVPHSVE